MDDATDFTKNDFVIIWPNAMKIHLLDDINQILLNTNTLVITEPYRYNFKTCNEFIYQKNLSLIKHLHASNYLNTFAFKCNNYLGRICYDKNGSINNKGKACLSRASLDFIKKCKDSVVWSCSFLRPAALAEGYKSTLVTLGRKEHDHKGHRQL
ncbi:hypothetical protein JTB14_016196 [Gonioctena quinquepunctata]|nr:hypothetical protein JTB14_016196 [Gonioctena quinquepunctata]